MTGYGLSRAEHKGKIIQAEIKSLNSKFLDLSIRSFPLSTPQDLWIRNECNQLIQRGKVLLTISQEEIESDSRKGKNAVLDMDLIQGYLDSLLPLAIMHGQNQENLLQACLGLPGVIKNSEEIPDEEIWSIIQKAISESLLEFNQFREREGKGIQMELEERVKLILSSLKIIEEAGPERIQIIRARLDTALQELKSTIEIDQNRFEQELIYYIDKIDFSEEVSRLNTHSRYFIDCLSEKESNGKKLGFIAQEMGREINTIGSKASDASIQQKVVQMKEELEKIKEQLANIL